MINLTPKRKILPPIWLILLLLLVFMADRWMPLYKFPVSLEALSASSTVVGLVIIFWPAASFARAKTGMVPFSDATSLVTGGLYRITRNPMYLGMTLILLGGALKLGTIGALLPVPLFPLVIQNRFIIPEERFLEETFGDEYRAYCQRVRRWL